MSPTARQHKRRRRQLEQTIAGSTTHELFPRPPAVAGMNGRRNRDRASLIELARYYAWSARKPFSPIGNDPRNGRPWPKYNPLAMQIARASDAAAARVCFARARAYPNPLAG